MERHFSNERK